MLNIILLCAALLAADPAADGDEAAIRAKKLHAHASTFRLELTYHGEQGKPFYRLLLSVPVVRVDASNSFYRVTQITREDAAKIIDHLARDGFLAQAVDLSKTTKLPPLTMPGYTLKVVSDAMPLQQDLGWGLTMLQRLDALYSVLPGNAKKDMDLLLGRLSGLRKQWEAAAKQ